MVDFESVRVAPELVEQLTERESEPVVVIGIERHDDGTLDMILRTVDPGENLRALRERVLTFGGFQRTPQGENWISRDDVLRAIDEALATNQSGVSDD